MSEFRLNYFWIILILFTVIFTFTYIYFSINFGKIDAEAYNYFSKEHINQSAKYAKIIRLNYIAAFILKIVFLTWFLFSGKAKYLSDITLNLVESRYLSAVVFFVIFWCMLQLISLPFNFYGSYIVQRQWGFSNQSIFLWCIDFIKNAGIEFIFSLTAVLVFFIIINNFSKTWWVITAVLLSFWLIVQSYLAPLVIAPLFNRFEPVTDPQTVHMVKNLSQKANLSVKEVLKMDASTRTNKVNAYFSGLGSSKRIVLYDNLLNNYTNDEIEAVIAHEMGHWKLGHIKKGILFGIAGLFIVFGLLYVVLKNSYIRTGFMLKYTPIIFVIVLYYFTMISFVTAPIQNIVSRNMEVEADSFAVKLTCNKKAAVDLQRKIAVSNLSDVSPPGFIEWFSYSHPSGLKRIKIIEEINIKHLQSN